MAARDNNKRPSARKVPQQNTATSTRQRAAASASRPQQRPSGSRAAAGPRQKSGARPQARNRPAQGARPTQGKRPAQGARPSSTRPSQPSAARPAAGKRPPNRRKPKRQLRWGRIFTLLAVIVLCVGLGVWAKGAFFTPDEVDATVAQSVSEPLVSDADKAGFDATINSDSAILINADNGDVLYEKDADTQRAPASLVKMMTAYVAIRNTDNIDRELQMPEDAYDGLEEEKASQSGLQKDETVTVRDLLYATLLKSGGDAANALALATSGNIESFVELMNAEAQDLGLDSTVFTNPTGLDDAKQVSTCRDMARLLKGALGNTTFREVFTSREYTTTANETHEEGLTLTHTMDKDLTTFQRYFDTSGYEIVGGKTGYTTNAGNCLASLAEKEGEPNYIVVTMHATGTGDQYYQAVHDAVTLYGEAYDR